MQWTCQFAKSREMKQLHFGFFDPYTGSAVRRQGTCVLEGERVFARELAGLTHWEGFKQDVKGWGDKIMITEDRSGGTMPVFERQCVSEVLWSAVSLVVGGGDPCNTKGYWCARNCRSTCKCSCRNWSIFPWKVSRIDHPNEVHLHICMQHGQQTGGTGTHCSAGKLWYRGLEVGDV